MATKAGGIRGITIEIGGDTTNLQDALKDVDRRTKSTQTELRQIDRLLKFDPTNVNLLAQRQAVLNNTIAATEDRLGQLRGAQEEVERQFQSGEIGEDAYRAFQREIIATEGRLNHFQQQLRETTDRIDLNVNDGDIDQADRKVRKLADTARDTGRAVGRGLKAGFEIGAKSVAVVGAALTGAAIGAGAFVESNKELNTLLARLRTNAETAGFSVESVEKAFKSVNEITGDTGAAVETVSNLLKTGFNENQLEEVLLSINGAAIAFSDTLKTEGIADGIQETFATGAAIGPFAELLERSGVNIDTFNEGLEKATAAGKETDYVLQQLANTGLAANNEGYRAANENLIAYNQSQLDAEIKSAELATALLPVATNFNELKGILIDVALGNTSVSEGVGELISRFAALGIELTERSIQAIQDFIQGFIDKFPELYKAGTDILVKVLEGVSDNFPQIVATVVQLVQTILRSVIDNLPTLLVAGLNLINGIAKGLVNNYPTIYKAGVDLLLRLVSGIITNLPQILAAALRIVGTLITGLASGAVQILTYLGGDLIPKMVKRFISFDWKSIGRNVVLGIRDGIVNSAKAAIDAVTNVASNIYNAAKKRLKIFSPSRAFQELGEFTNQGFEVGIEKSAPSLTRTVEHLYGSLGDSAVRSIDNQQAQSNLFTSNANNNTDSIINAILALASRPVEAMLAIDGRVVTQTVDNYQLGNNNIAAALKGV